MSNGAAALAFGGLKQPATAGIDECLVTRYVTMPALGSA